MVPNSVHFRGSLFVDSVPCVPEERNSLDVYAKMWNDLKSRLWKSTSFFCKPIIKNKMNHSANKWKNALPKQGKFVGHDVSTAFVCQFAKVFSPQDFWPRQHVWPSCRTHPSSALQFGDQHRALCCTCRRPPLPSPRTRWRSHWPAAWSWLSQIVSFYGWDVLYAINLDTGVFIA